MNFSRFIKIAIIQITAVVLVGQSHGLNTETHEQINERVVTTIMDGFSLDLYLKHQLGLDQGVQSQLQGVIENKKHTVRVWQWFREGGIREDLPNWYMPYIRSANHFHNPLTDQGFSGIWGTGLISGDSAIAWSQRALGTQSPGGYYSWHDARSRYFEALTAQDPVAREGAFAEAFRGLGQLMHLLQDMSVPEHTRDDGHYLPAYEAWVSTVENGVPNVDISTVSPIFFDSPAIGNPNALGPIPFANLFDTNQYVLPDPDPSKTWQSGIGLSEYTNANFLSPDTMFTSEFPYPRADQCSLIVDARNNRQYLSNRGNSKELIGPLLWERELM